MIYEEIYTAQINTSKGFIFKGISHRAIKV